MTSKKTTKKDPQKKTTKKKKSEVMLKDNLIDDLPATVPNKVSNKKLFEKSIDMERRLVRIEKLILMLVDEAFFTREEKAKVDTVERLVREGKFDELDALVSDNKL